MNGTKFQREKKTDDLQTNHGFKTNQSWFKTVCLQLTNHGQFNQEGIWPTYDLKLILLGKLRGK